MSASAVSSAVSSALGAVETLITAGSGFGEQVNRIAPALGVSYGNEIVLLPQMTSANEFSTLSHEATHSLLHQRKDRESLPRRVLETEAEAAAYVVCQAIGLDSTTSASDYIHLYHGAQALAASLDRIQRTAAQIITAIGPDV